MVRYPYLHCIQLATARASWLAQWHGKPVATGARRFTPAPRRRPPAWAVVWARHPLPADALDVRVRAASIDCRARDDVFQHVVFGPIICMVKTHVSMAARFLDRSARRFRNRWPICRNHWRSFEIIGKLSPGSHGRRRPDGRAMLFFDVGWGWDGKWPRLPWAISRYPKPWRAWMRNLLGCEGLKSPSASAGWSCQTQPIASRPAGHL
jgi:hypothetical protein